MEKSKKKKTKADFQRSTNISSKSSTDKSMLAYCYLIIPILIILVFSSINPFLWKTSQTQISQPIHREVDVTKDRNISIRNSQKEFCLPSGKIEDSCCDYDTVQNLSDNIRPVLENLTQTIFFKYFKVELYKSCHFWQEDLLCVQKDCAVQVIPSEEIPPEWDQLNLSTVNFSPMGKDFQPFKHKKHNDKDFCIIEESSAGVYVDLIKNPERFTGYAGQSAARVWKTIYEENCFDIPRKLSKDINLDISSRKIPFISPPKDPNDLAGYVQALNKSWNLFKLDDICMEKRVFYRLISGLHASISIHICDEYYDKEKGDWVPNLDCFVYRLAQFPERIHNIYFNYAILTRAVVKMKNYLLKYDFCTGDIQEEQTIRDLIKQLVDSISTCPETFDEKTLFNGEANIDLKNEFKHHFRNITQIMDCVGCEKCRVWGKLQTLGLGTALKTLFSYDDRAFETQSSSIHFERSEVVALINTLNQFSKSLNAVKRFNDLYSQSLS